MKGSGGVRVLFLFILQIDKIVEGGVGVRFFERDLIRKHVLTCNGMLTVIEV